MNKELDQVASDRSIERIKQLLIEDLSQAEIVNVLNAEGYCTIRARPWTRLNLRQVIWKIRHQTKSWYNLSARRAQLTIETVH